MPSISMFYGIIVYMYFIDNKQHHVPHIHALTEMFLKVAFQSPK